MVLSGPHTPHYRTFALTRHRTEQGEERPKVAKGVSKMCTSYKTSNIGMIQTSETWDRDREGKGEGFVRVCGDSEYRTRYRTNLFCDLSPKNRHKSALSMLSPMYCSVFGVTRHYRTSFLRPPSSLLDPMSCSEKRSDSVLRDLGLICLKSTGKL